MENYKSNKLFNALNSQLSIFNFQFLLCFSLLTFSFSLSAYAQSADSIINKCINALGGKEKLSTINTIYQEGTSDANGNTIHTKRWAINNKYVRVQSEINGMTNYTIFRTDSGWSYNPRRGQKQAEPLTHDAVRRALFGMDIQSPFLNYKQKGYTIKYLGKDDEIDGADTYKLELKVNDSLIVTYYVDPDSYFVMRTKTRSIANGRSSSYTTDYSDYQKNFDGYIFPMEVGSGRGQTKYTLIKVNGDIDMSLFRPGK